MNNTICKCNINKRIPDILVTHIFNKEDIVEIRCKNCGNLIIIVSMEEIYKNKHCYCCYYKE